MRIDIWSDVVCPWCYLGFTRLDKALAQYEGEVEVYHHAFQLDPHAGPQPISAVKHLAESYGIDDESVLGMMEDVTEAAATDGLSYRLPETLHGNTRLAHRLLAAAATVGCGHALLQRIFHAYFEQAESVFTADDLRPHAIAVGMPADLIDQVLNGDAFDDIVAYDIATAEEIGVRSVPFFAFNQRVAIAGAESVEVLVAAMAKADALV